MTMPISLTKYPSGSFKEFLSIVAPLILSALSVVMLELCDSIFIARYSTSAWETVTTAQFMFHCFQLPIALIVMMSHPFISTYLGSNHLKKIGPLVWQMIYFALASTLVVWLLFPLSKQYLYHTEIQSRGLDYLNLMIRYFFLFPLGIALAMFHLGCCRPKMILVATVITQIVNVILDYVLIFGLGTLVPSLGVQGAAMATLIAQSVFCAILLFSFLSKTSRDKYQTDAYSFNFSIMWPVLKKGFLRSFFAAVSLGGSLVGAFFLINRGGDHLLVFSFGFTLLNIIYCFLDGYGPAIITVASSIIGSKQFHLYKNLSRNALLFGSMFFLTASILMIALQDFIIKTYVKESLSRDTVLLLKQTLFFMVMVCATGTFAKTIDGVLMALKKMGTYAFICIIYALLMILLPFIFFDLFDFPPSFFFFTIGFVKGCSGLIVFILIKKHLHLSSNTYIATTPTY